MTRRFALAAALAVALAGCGAFAPAGGPGTPEETMTALPVPTDTPTPSEALSPPGVAANGSISSSVLATAHRRALADSSFTGTVEYERADLETGVTVDAVSKRLEVGGDGSYLTRTVWSADQRQALYADGTAAYSRTVLGNASTVRRLDDAIDYRNYLTTAQSLQTYLATREASVSRVERRGTTYYRVHVTEPPPAIRGGHPKQTVRNYTATAYLTPQGRLRTLAVRYDYTLRTDHVEVSLRIDYENVGQTTVDRPAWATEADPTTTAPSPAAAQR